MGELKGAMTLNAVPNLFVLLTQPNPKQFVSACSLFQHAFLVTHHTACELDYMSPPQLSSATKFGK